MLPNRHFDGRIFKRSKIVIDGERQLPNGTRKPIGVKALEFCVMLWNALRPAIGSKDDQWPGSHFASGETTVAPRVDGTRGAPDKIVVVYPAPGAGPRSLRSAAKRPGEASGRSITGYL
jgi:hypothetical protein